MRVVTFKVNEELLTKLDLHCLNSRRARSEVIREAIEFYLSQQKTGRVYRKSAKAVEGNPENIAVMREP